MLLAQAACLLVLVGWSVHHAPGDSGKPAAPEATVLPVAPPHTPDDVVIDNSDDQASAGDLSEVDSRFVAPSQVRFRTDHPPAGALNLRPVETRSPAASDQWQPVHPQNPPRRAPTGPRTPFEVSGNGATVYNPPPPSDEN